MFEIDRPKLEGSVAVGVQRRLGFAQFGKLTARPYFWLHGTPGARRQIPPEARQLAIENELCIIGLDRPGVGSSTPYRYRNVLEFATDLLSLANALDIEEFGVIGLSGGGPYSLATAYAAPDRVKVVGIMGGVAPAVGPEAIRGGATDLAKLTAPILEVAGAPIGRVISSALSVARPVAEPAISLFARFSPRGDRELLARPEFRAMFLDDLLHGGSRRMEAPFADGIVFARDWGFRVADLQTPVMWWHGDRDHIIPYAHGEHMVSLMPNAKLFDLANESHLGGLGAARAILAELDAAWER
ncbi:MAG: alpha/beta hydrolase [Gordonia sp. (in: high G+C Gram-positive bacteria)]|uniref:alpha/beta fold hydrolase n=1 Tax=Gordonia sp. (in: high G+C Gram-positive bacteria) TaxID=84139 RepID=UPI003BB6BC64